MNVQSQTPGPGPLLAAGRSPWREALKWMGLLTALGGGSLPLAAASGEGEAVVRVWDHQYEITISGEAITRLDVPSGTKRTLALPPGTVFAVYGEGGCWALERTTEGLPSEGKDPEGGTEDPRSAALPFQRIFHCGDFTRWEEFGRLEGADDVHAAILVPLKDGRLFLSSGFGWHYFQGTYAPFYLVAKASDARLVCAENINLDLGLPFAPKPGVLNPGRDFSKLDLNRKYLICTNLRFEYPRTVFPMEHCFVLASLQMGVFWKFDLDGHLERRIQLYPSMADEDFKAPFRFERAVVHCQATPDQGLIVASRTQEAVRFKQELYPTVPLPGRPQVSAGDAGRNETRGNDLFPDIEYYSIDLDEGKAIALATPLNAPSNLHDLPRDGRPWFEFQGNGVPVFVVRPRTQRAEGAPPARKEGSGGPAVPPGGPRRGEETTAPPPAKDTP